MEKSSKLTILQKVKVMILSLVIAIVLSSFVLYSIQSIHKIPKYEDFCGDVRGPINIPSDKEIQINQTSCVGGGGYWRNGYCDYYYECQKEFEDANNKHQLIVFLVSVPLGLLVIGIGVVLGLPSVSTGLMLGGVFLTIYGTSNYWSNFTDWLKVIILGIVLIVLIFLGYKKLKN